jgi:hypothetical protein
MGHYRDIASRLIKLGPFVSRPRGGWRFGARTISDPIVARLIASGHARRDGDRIVRSERLALSTKEAEDLTRRST